MNAHEYLNNNITAIASFYNQVCTTTYGKFALSICSANMNMAIFNRLHSDRIQSAA